VESQHLLEVKGLAVTLKRDVEIVRSVSFNVDARKVVGVVGESGSGKSMMVRAIMGLHPAGSRISGSVRLRGEEMIGLPERRLRDLRGARIGMIFQDPMTALNPVIRIGDLIAEAIRLHHPEISGPQARRRAVALLETVSVPEPEVRARQYVHEFSGGMRQRAMIAMAIANNPDVLIADEPTTALDVTVQAQIVEVLKNLREAFPVGLVLISHDLGIIAGVADTVAVMYAGRLVEMGTVEDVFSNPRHPYTRGLLGCLPRADVRVRRLTPIPGAPPSLAARPPGCPFHPRCPIAREFCTREEPQLRPVGAVLSACHFAEEIIQPDPGDSLPMVASG
jgi:peptide/nickel transport system ATP-binding protein